MIRLPSFLNGFKRLKVNSLSIFLTAACLLSQLISTSSQANSVFEQIRCNQILEASTPSDTRLTARNILDSTQDIPSAAPILKAQNTWSKLGAPGKIAWNWLHSTIHNLRGIYAVLDLMKFRKLGPRLISEDHPWATGFSPHIGKTIWTENIAFASPRDPRLVKIENDLQIVTTLGRFMAAMVKRSTGQQEIPQGPKRRMPHAVNYIHGTVHFNGVFLVFNDFKDAMFYFTDARFVNEFKRLAKQERREITIVFRDRNYKEHEYAYFMGFIRSSIPWYANGNGPKKKVFYGGMSGFPAVNTINGSWIADMYNLKNGKLDALVRPPINKGLYFQEKYQGDRIHFNLAERAFAHLYHWIIGLRGAQGGMVFTPRELIEPGSTKIYEATGRLDVGADWPMPTLQEDLLKAIDQNDTADLSE